MNNNFEFLEKIVLSILIVCTVIAIGMEIQANDRKSQSYTSRHTFTFYLY